MLAAKKIVVIMPAYNAELTIEQTYTELPHDIIDLVIVTDDGSSDQTLALAKRLGVQTFSHEKNLGYGANQKTCYQHALEAGADIVVMVHPDYQYSPRLVTPLVAMVASGHYDLVLGSRILGGGALRGGMPKYKYIANRLLTLVQNWICGAKLSEYHTGFRAYSAKLLQTIPFHQNSNDFIFDNQVLMQTLYFGFQIGEISCPTRYFEEASSIGLYRSIIYGLEVLWNALLFRLQQWGLWKSRIFLRVDAGASVKVNKL